MNERLNVESITELRRANERLFRALDWLVNHGDKEIAPPGDVARTLRLMKEYTQYARNDDEIISGRLVLDPEHELSARFD